MSISAPRAEGSYGFTGDSIEIHGGHFTMDGEMKALVAAMSESAQVESSVRRDIDPPTG
jgi:hypothetical protein